MTSDFTQESLQLTITEAVYASDVVLSMNDILQHLFGIDNHLNVSNTLKTYVNRIYINQLKGFIRHFGKKHIYEQLKAGSTNFIRRFEQQTSLERLFDNIPRIQLRIKCLLDQKSEGSLFDEFSRYFNRLRNRFVSIQAEENFRLALIGWFHSGEMTKTIRNELDQWSKTGANLCKFKTMNFKSATNRDSFKTKVIKAVQSVHTDEFMEHENLKQILSKFLSPGKIRLENKKLLLKGRTIFLSDWIDDIVKKCTNHSDFDVEVYAADCCGIDCNINLFGINFVIYSNKVYVWKQHSISLSGLTYK